MSDENLNISCDAQMFARANEVLRTEIDRLRAENERLRAELDRVLSDWNGLVYVLGVNKYGTALDHARAMRRDAERYRHVRSNINAVQALVRPDAVPRLVGGELEELGRYCDECIDNVMRSSGRVSDE